jgi:hypothetical protein
MSTTTTAPVTAGAATETTTPTALETRFATAKELCLTLLAKTSHTKSTLYKELVAKEATFRHSGRLLEALIEDGSVVEDTPEGARIPTFSLTAAGRKAAGLPALKATKGGARKAAATAGATAPASEDSIPGGEATPPAGKKGKGRKASCSK